MMVKPKDVTEDVSLSSSSSSLYHLHHPPSCSNVTTTAKASNIVKSQKQKYAIEMMSGTATVGLMSENDRIEQQRHEYETGEGNTTTTTKSTTRMKLQDVQINIFSKN